MAGVCDGNWDSKINNNDDGVIEIRPPVEGFFSGTHHKSNRQLLGRCVDARVPHIRLVRMHDDGCVYVYDGDIIRVDEPAPHFEIDNGTVIVACPSMPIEGKRASVTVPDEWTAEKPT